MKTKQYLVPFDGSGHSEKTLSKSCELARDRNAELTILQVMDRVPISSQVAGSELYSHDLQSDIRAAKDAEFMKIKPVLEIAGIEWDRKLDVGQVPDTIIRFANSWNFDMIIMGYHGSNFIERFFKRPTCERVISEAECDVLVVT